MTQDIRIELAKESDIPRILEISNAAAERSAANFATKPETLESWAEAWKQHRVFHPWLVAKSGEKIIGFAKSAPYRNREAYDWTAEVSIYLDFEFHGQGLGSRLYKILISMLQAQGYVTLIAGITGGQEPSEKLHEKMGFVRCANFHRVGWKFERWYDVGFWELHLQPSNYTPRPILPVPEIRATF